MSDKEICLKCGGVIINQPCCCNEKDVQVLQAKIDRLQNLFDRLLEDFKKEEDHNDELRAEIKNSKSEELIREIKYLTGRISKIVYDVESMEKPGYFFKRIQSYSDEILKNIKIHQKDFSDD